MKPSTVWMIQVFPEHPRRRVSPARTPAIAERLLYAETTLSFQGFYGCS